MESKSPWGDSLRDQVKPIHVGEIQNNIHPETDEL